MYFTMLYMSKGVLYHEDNSCDNRNIWSKDKHNLCMITSWVVFDTDITFLYAVLNTNYCKSNNNKKEKSIMIYILYYVFEILYSWIIIT